MRKRELVEVFESNHFKRSIYDRLQTLLPDNAFVYQHRSILEREIKDPDSAIEFAKKAMKLEPRNSAILNTLGLAYEAAARLDKDPLKKRFHLSEASKLFDQAVSRDSSDAFGHLGQYYVSCSSIDSESDNDRKQQMKLKALANLQAALELTDFSNVIAKPLAKLKEELGSRDEATMLLKTGLERDKSDSKIRDLYIEFLAESESYVEALEIAAEGITYDPTSWRFHRHVARLMKKLDKPFDSIKGHYESAIRCKPGEIDLLIEFGGWLILSGNEDIARDIFEKALNLDVMHHEKQKGRYWCKDSLGSNQSFKGKVVKFRGAGAFLRSVPDNIEAFMWRSGEQLSNLKVGDEVEFNLGFNAFGAFAKTIHS